jgi:CHAT domain
MTEHETSAAATETTPDRVVGLVYVLGRDEVSVALVERGSWRWVSLGPVRPLLEPAAALRDELADPMKVSRGRVPRLREFAAGWGRGLLPPEVLASPPDVLVVIPHEFVHQLPLQLVLADDGRALALRSGIAYCSSITLFCQVTRRPRAPRTGAAAGVDVLDDGPDRFAGLATEIGRWFPAETGGASTPVAHTAVHYMKPGSDQRELLAKLHGSADLATPAVLNRTVAKHLLHKPRADLICLVAHGYVDPERHARSGLLLAATIDTWRQLRVYDRDMTFPDRPLRETPATLPIKRDSELFTLAELELDEPATAGVVMLVACSAGASLQLRADEPGSLAESLLRRGGASVIAPMWDCDFEVAQAWTQAFFDAWTSRGQPVALAMRDAFGELGDGRDPGRLGPFHLRGDWR